MINNVHVIRRLEVFQENYDHIGNAFVIEISKNILMI